MILYETRPSPAVLVAFGFQRYPEARMVRLHLEDAAMTYQDHPNPDPTCTGPTMNLSVSVLWSLLKAEQELWQQTHPHELVTSR